MEVNKMSAEERGVSLGNAIFNITLGGAEANNDLIDNGHQIIFKHLMYIRNGIGIPMRSDIDPKTAVAETIEATVDWASKQDGEVSMKDIGIKFMEIAAKTIFD